MEIKNIKSTRRKEHKMPVATKYLKIKDIEIPI